MILKFKILFGIDYKCPSVNSNNYHAIFILGMFDDLKWVAGLFRTWK